jgi:hypothetical protein
MTSKQAKKAYREANKAPKMSKKERERLEKEELERMRKEREKERAQERARLAREKKAGKEREEKEKRRKEGLPLEKVRPSQATITGFIGRKRVLEEEGDESEPESAMKRLKSEEYCASQSKSTTSTESTACSDNHSMENSISEGGPSEDKYVERDERGDITELSPREAQLELSTTTAIRETAKPPTVVDLKRNTLDVSNDILDQSRLAQEHSINTEKQNPDFEPEDEFGDFPSLSQFDLPALFAEHTSPVRGCSNKAESGSYGSGEDRDVLKTALQVTDQAKPTVTSRSMAPPTHNLQRISQNRSRTDRDTSEEVQTGAALAKDCNTTRSKPAEAPTSRAPTPPKVVLQSSPTSADATVPPNRSGPSSVREAVHRALRSARLSSSAASSGLKRDGGASTKHDALMLPPPRPQPTGRVPLGERSRNIPAPLVPLNNKHPTVTKRQLSVQQTSRYTVHECLPPSSTQIFLENNLDDFLPSPSQQIRELMEDVGHDDIPSNTQIARELDGDEEGSATDTGLFSAEESVIELPFSTQAFGDLDFSSQDLRAIEADTPCKPPLPKVGPETLKIKPKGRFFEEKEDDLMHAALHESLLLQKERERRLHSEKINEPRPKRSYSRTLSTGTDYGDDIDLGSQEFLEVLRAADGLLS